MSDKETSQWAKPADARNAPGTNDPATPWWKQKWFVPTVLVLAAGLTFGVMQLGKSSEGKRAAPPPPDPKTTGQLVVKSNLPGATFEALRAPTAAEAATPGIEVALNQPLAGLPPGHYTVTGHAEGWPDLQEVVDIVAQSTTEIAMKFPSGSLRLDSDPGGAVVRLGKVSLGRTPLTLSQLPPGECELAIEYAYWPSISFRTKIIENQQVTDSVHIPHGRLTLESTPSGAKVRQGGGTLGETPMTLENVAAGTNQFVLSAEDFPTIKVSITMKDGADMKANIGLGEGFPALDPSAVLRSVWVPDNPDNMAPPFDGLSGPSAPRNGVIKNLDRKKLSVGWLRKKYHFSGVVKAFDPSKGQVDFVDAKSELAPFKVVAIFSPGALAAKDLATRVTKGATLDLYGLLGAVEEPRWPFKLITLELSAAELLH